MKPSSNSDLFQFVSGDVVEVLSNCLNRNPNERYDAAKLQVNFLTCLLDN